MVAFDDAWQLDGGLPHPSQHIGQMTMVHELLSTQDFAPLFIPLPRNGSKAGLRAQKGNWRFAALVRTAARAPSPFATHKTAALRKCRSPLTAGRADALRVSAIGADGGELAVSWVKLPLV